MQRQSTRKLSKDRGSFYFKEQLLEEDFSPIKDSKYHPSKPALLKLNKLETFRDVEPWAATFGQSPKLPKKLRAKTKAKS